MKHINKTVAITATALAALLVLTGCGGAKVNSGSSEPEINTVSSTDTPTARALGSSERFVPTPEACAEVQSYVDSTPGAVVQLVPMAQLAACKPLLTAQCRVTAVTAYMEQQGFTEDEWVAGEGNIDPTAAALSIAGGWSFIQGNPPVTNKELGEFFVSDEPGAVEQRSNIQAKSPSIKPSVLFDPYNWEIVQLKTGSWMMGNTGFTAGKTVSAGTRKNSSGDAVWIYVDPGTCKVPLAEVQPPTTNPNDPPAVIMMRPGCRNGGDNIWPERLFPKDPSLSFQAGRLTVGGGHNEGPGNYTGPLAHNTGSFDGNPQGPVVGDKDAPDGSNPGGDPVSGPSVEPNPSSTDEPNTVCDPTIPGTVCP